LRDAKLTGLIHPNVKFLTELEELDLFNNNLSGSLLENLKNLPDTPMNLAYIYLSFNRITGPIPEYIGKLTKLKVLALSNNLLSGRLPQNLDSLTSLEYLYLSNNQLSGVIPENLPALVIFLLSESIIRYDDCFRQSAKSQSTEHRE
jgi:somatic embryogenesis receptor kinase 1